MFASRSAVELATIAIARAFITTWVLVVGPDLASAARSRSRRSRRSCTRRSRADEQASVRGERNQPVQVEAIAGAQDKPTIAPEITDQQYVPNKKTARPRGRADSILANIKRRGQRHQHEDIPVKEGRHAVRPNT
jgi:hypothetical protein